jgi:putative hemolysin
VAHIVDSLIEERAERLRNHPRIWQWVQRSLYPILGYDEAVALIDSVQTLSGYDVFEHISQMLNMRITVEGAEHIPKMGRAVIMPNHPAGMADGIAVFDALKKARPDVVFFANRDAIRCHERMNEIIIPVEWMEQRRTHAKTKETVRNVIQAFRDERLVVIFASGRLARPTPVGLIERPWLASGVGLAQKYDCPIVPMHVAGHNSALYYLLWFLNTELRDMTLFRELLNKTNQKYHIHIGQPVLSDEPSDTLTPALRKFVTKELKHGCTVFQQSNI